MRLTADGNLRSCLFAVDETDLRGPMRAGASDDELRALQQGFAESFRDTAPVTPAQAATIILDGVRAGRWRILVGDDAHALDEAVRADPEAAYHPIAVLYQDFLVRCRIRGLAGKPPDLVAFRRLLAIGRAGAGGEMAERPEWPEALSRAAALPSWEYVVDAPSVSPSSVSRAASWPLVSSSRLAAAIAVISCM